MIREASPQSMQNIRHFAPLLPTGSASSNNFKICTGWRNDFYKSIENNTQPRIIPLHEIASTIDAPCRKSVYP